MSLIVVRLFQKMHASVPMPHITIWNHISTIYIILKTNTKNTVARCGKLAIHSLF